MKTIKLTFLVMPMRFLISNYAANAGKSGGEFFTPQHVSKLIAQLAMHKQDIGK
ncbi:MAG: N-6 DNA methylase [Paludibacteraceae bacterium]